MIRKGEDSSKEKAFVLIVEDDRVLAAMWQRYLQDHGCIVDVCNSVEDAEVLFHSNSYDVAIIDIFFRDANQGMAEGGVTLINRLRLNEVVDVEKKKVMILAITGAPERGIGEFNVLDSVTGLSDSVVRKPVPLEKLSEEINRLFIASAKVPCSTL